MVMVLGSPPAQSQSMRCTYASSNSNCTDGAQHHQFLRQQAECMAVLLADTRVTVGWLLPSLQSLLDADYCYYQHYNGAAIQQYVYYRFATVTNFGQYHLDRARTAYCYIWQQ